MRWTSKPPYGSRLDASDYFSRDLLGLWLMNEGAGSTIYDIGGLRHHGQLLGNVGWTASSVGPVLNFPGDSGDYVTTTLLQDLIDNEDNFTLMVHFWSADSSADRHIMYIGESGGNGWGGEDEAHLSIADDGDIYATYTNTEGSDTAPPNETWNTVVGTFSQGEANLYVNGVFLDQHIAYTPTLTDPDVEPLRFGRPGIDGRYFPGMISHAAVYKRMLSAAEIAQLYVDPYRMVRPPRRRRYISSGAVSDLSVSVAELINSTESMGRALPLGFVAESETMTVNELRELLISIAPSLFETINIVELTSFILAIKPDVFQTLNVAEFVAAIRDSHLIDRYETINLSDVATLVTNLIGSAHDIITVSEDIGTALSGVGLSASDLVTLTEIATAAMLLGGISKHEVIQVIEYAAAEIGTLPGLQVSKSELMQVVESATAAMLLGGISKEETIEIIEVSLALTSLEVEQDDTIQIIENVIADISDTSGIYLGTFSQIGIIESVLLAIKLKLSIADVVNVAEYIVMGGHLGDVSDLDTLTVEESSTVDINLPIYQQQIVAITEQITGRFDWELVDVAQVVQITEFIVGNTGGWGFELAQDLTVSEYVFLSMIHFVLHNFTASSRAFNFTAQARAYHFEANQR